MTITAVLAIGSGAAEKFGNVTGNVAQFAHPETLSSDTLV